MQHRFRLCFSSLMTVGILLALVCGSLVETHLARAAEPFADPAFNKVWNRTDSQIASGALSRTYLWGPEPFTTGLQEDYVEGTGGKRLVQYFDKSRMEITNPAGDKNSIYYVTNGLIARELMTGQLQLGNDKFESRQPSTIGVAGDADDTSGPTYKVMGKLTGDATNQVNGSPLKAVNREGVLRDAAQEFSQYQAPYAYYEAITKHNVAKPFWDFLNQSGPVLNDAGQSVNGRLFDPIFYATGLPITEAYWSKVKVAGEVKDLLAQCYERRCLTYTPSNGAAYRVEMGNVGRHYYDWRYNSPTPPVATPPVTTPPANIPPPVNFSGTVSKDRQNGDFIGEVTLSKGLAKLTTSEMLLPETQGARSHSLGVGLFKDGGPRGGGITYIAHAEVSLYVFIAEAGTYQIRVVANGNWKLEVQDWQYLKNQQGQAPTGTITSTTGPQISTKFSIPSDGTITLQIQYNSNKNDGGIFSFTAYKSVNGEAAYSNTWLRGGTLKSEMVDLPVKKGDFYLDLNGLSYGPSYIYNPAVWSVDISFRPN